MSTPLLWIVLPVLLAGVLLLVQRWEWLVAILGTLIAVALAVLALKMPVRELMFIGPWTIRLSDTWSVLGRQFVLGVSERPSLVMLYTTAAFWFGASKVARAGRWFVPLGLLVVALLTAAIVVEPFLYAALLLELVVLVSVPLLNPPGQQVGRGVLRYLAFQTMGLPFILFSGWMLTGVETASGEPAQLLRVAVLIGLGFAFMVGVVPFHTWIPMLTEESQPYAAAFILLLLPEAVVFLGLSFINHYAWLKTSPGLPLLLRSTGVVMVILAGVWAAFQRHLGRIFGYSVILQIGLSLVFISMGLLASPVEAGGLTASLGVFFASLLPHGLALGVWALALTVIQAHAGGLRYRQVQGLARRVPLAAGGVVLANFSSVGLPLLAGFSVRMALLNQLAEISLPAALGVLLGIVGLLVAGLRTLAVLIMGVEENTRSEESWSQRLFLAVGMLALVIVGLIPQWVLPLAADLPGVFLQMSR